jgi:hypothetical protein
LLFKTWGWSSNRNLLNHIIASWNNWKRLGNIIKIYIAESKQDVTDALDDAGITNEFVRSKIIEKF